MLLPTFDSSRTTTTLTIGNRMHSYTVTSIWRAKHSTYTCTHTHSRTRSTDGRRQRYATLHDCVCMRLCVCVYVPNAVRVFSAHCKFCSICEWVCEWVCACVCVCLASSHIFKHIGRVAFIFVSALPPTKLTRYVLFDVVPSMCVDHSRRSFLL